jgi:hypothetical protein
MTILSIPMIPNSQSKINHNDLNHHESMLIDMVFTGSFHDSKGNHWVIMKKINP